MFNQGLDSDVILSSVTHNSKTIRCMKILYIPNDFSTTGHLLFWFGAAYELRLESYGQETVSEYARRACSSTSGVSVYIIRVWHV